MLFGLLLGFNYATAGHKKFFFDKVTSNDGLSGNTVLSFYQDNKGYIWVATTNGLNRYNAYSFKVYANNKQDMHSISGNHINSLTSDHQGNLWIATLNDGLNLYIDSLDRFICFNPENSGLNSSIIRKVFCDSKNRLWIGSADAGLFVMDPVSRQIESVKPNMPSLIVPEDINDIIETRKGEILIAKTRDGVYKYNESTKALELYIPVTSDFDNDFGTRLFMLEVNNDLWVGTNGNGILVFRGQKKIVHFSTVAEQPKQLTNNIVSDLLYDSFGNIWASTDGGGVNLIDPLNFSVKQHIMIEPDNPRGLNTNQLFGMFEDVDKTIWIGSFKGGINKYNPYKQRFDSYSPSEIYKNSISHKSILEIVEDRKKNIWIATDGGGLNIYKEQRDDYFEAICNTKSNANRLSGNIVTSMVLDSAGNLWLGTWNRGLMYFNTQTFSFKTLVPIPGKNSLSDFNILSLMGDSFNNLWIGTLSAAVDVYSPFENRFTNHYQPNNPCGISQPAIIAIVEDLNKNVWVGTEGNGLYLYDKTKNCFINFKHNANNPSSICGNNINTLFVSSKNKLYIGAEGSGLDLYDRQKNTFVHLSEMHKLPTKNFRSVLEDNHGNLWISTDIGILKYNPVSGENHLFTMADGLPGNEFNTTSALKSSSGRFYFGSTEGLCAFHPDSIALSFKNPKVVIANVKVANVPLSAGSQMLPFTLDFTREIRIPYKHRFFSIEFAALDYLNTEKIQYRYKLEGFNNNWVYTLKNREATYTNLDGGKYTFIVESCNVDGLWLGNPRKLVVYIVPPIYKAIWFRVLVFLFIAFMVIGLFIYRVKHIKAINLKLENLVSQRTQELKSSNEMLVKQSSDLAEINTLLEERQQQIEEQTEEIKSQRDALHDANKTLKRFFSIIAHDLKNPLSTILGFAELMELKYKTWSIEKIGKSAEHIRNSALTIKSLLDNLLQWAGSQSGAIRFNPEFYLLKDVLAQGVEPNINSALAKEISINIGPNDAEVQVRLDFNMITTVFRNLVSNAIKYTMPGGNINISAQLKNYEWVFAVEDTGVGIDPEHLPTLFKIDNKHTSKGTNDETGTGLGLVLCREFVEKHGGIIQVVSEPGKGSRFVFTIPQ
ncbi:MAG: hypothetical protein JXB34_08335 [Bacteroidales bacterium]|nr:hypothetical protein [Bacteroidales bacterium]